jgi:glycerol kinase
MGSYILSLDQGTTSSRAILFDHNAQIVASSQREHRQIFPQAGWVEHDPKEIWAAVREVMGEVLSRAEITRHDVAGIGVTNQRETAVVWNRKTGEPVYNAIVWQDTRTQDLIAEMEKTTGSDFLRKLTGLPLATYFSASKIRWILDNVEGARSSAEAGELAFGTLDTWLVWNLTGGVKGGIHITDVTNASRTLLMNLHTCAWDPELLELWDIPASMLPGIRSSSEVYGVAHTSSLLREVPIAGILGDQQAATFGQVAFDAGESKNTYGTGNFLIVNTGEKAVVSTNGLLTTVAYQLGEAAPRYALEGSIAVTGSLIQWLRDNLGLISDAAEVETLAASVPDNGGCYIVPAFSGLYAPYWRPDARGVIVGLTRFVNKGHIARAALEATAFQTREVLDAMNADNGADLKELKVDGGMVANDTLMQFQADILGVPVVRPQVIETTALGAAFVAGLAVGYWSDREELRATWSEDTRFEPSMDASARVAMMTHWKKAVTRSFDWVD